MTKVIRCANTSTAEGVFDFVAKFFGKDIFSVSMKDKGRSFKYIFFDTGMFDMSKNSIYILEGNTVYYAEGEIEESYPDKLYYVLKHIVDTAIEDMLNNTQKGERDNV